MNSRFNVRPETWISAGSVDEYWEPGIHQMLGLDHKPVTTPNLAGRPHRLTQPASYRRFPVAANQAQT